MLNKFDAVSVAPQNYGHSCTFFFSLANTKRKINYSKLNENYYTRVKKKINSDEDTY